MPCVAKGLLAANRCVEEVIWFVQYRVRVIGGDGGGKFGFVEGFSLNFTSLKPLLRSEI